MSRLILRMGVAVLAVTVAACGTDATDETPALQQARPSRSYQAVVTNGGFETGTLGQVPPSPWVVERYLNNTGVTGSATNPPNTIARLNLATSGTAKQGTFIVGGSSGTTGSQVDPDLGSGQTFRFPLYGAKAARVNTASTDASERGQNKNVNVLKQTFTVQEADRDTDGKIHVRFAVAPVLENPSHGYTEQPYFFILVTNKSQLDAGQPRVLYQTFNRAGEEGVPWHNTNGIRPTVYPIQWLDWSLIDVSPSVTDLVPGNEVELTIIAGGCQPGGHFGRVYVDGVGSFIPGIFVAASAAADVNSGQDLTYTFRYQNGDDVIDATGVSIRIKMPTNVTWKSTTRAGCTFNNSVLTCPIGNLAHKASGSFDVVVTVPANGTGTVVMADYDISATGSPTLLGSTVRTTIHAACTTSASCSTTNQPICTSGQCTECASDAECAAKAAARPYCSEPGACVQCLADANCTTGAAPICSQSTYTCGKCTSNSQCQTRNGTAAPVCDPTEGGCHLCPQLSAPTNGTVSGTNGDSGTTRTYACNAGYTLTGNASRQCQADGTWTGSAPTCVAKACTPDLTAPANGSITPANGRGVTGDNVTYSCNTAYTLSGGSAQRTCQTSSTWSGTAPTCTQIPGRCTSDAMCASTEWCNISTTTCTTKSPNGATMPTDTGHTTPTINGTCNAPAAALVCQYGDCDTDNRCGYVNGNGSCTVGPPLEASDCRSGACSADSKCGYRNGEGPCTTVDVAVCRSGACSPNANVCVPNTAGACAVDADCNTATEWCNTETFSCTPKLANGDDLPTVAGHTPVLDHTCTTPVAQAVCLSSVCSTADSKCGYPVGVGPCTADAAGDALCRSGHCGTASLVCVPADGCTIDADCATTDFCDTTPGTFLCKPKIPNGGGIPAIPDHDPALIAICEEDVALAVCVSGVCSTSDNLCGYPNGQGPCTQANALDLCRSGVCSPNGNVCIPLNGCAVDADCAGTEWCDPSSLSCVPKIVNGGGIPTVGGHQPDLNGTCTPAVGTSVCVAGVCDSDNNCGLRGGNGPCDATNGATVCRSAVCDTANGVCLGDVPCTVDTDCDTTTQFCNTQVNVCQAKVGNGQPLPAATGHTPPLDGTCNADAALVVCLSGVCDNADDLCGFRTGTGPCTEANASSVCRSGLCGTDADGSSACIACQVDDECRASGIVCREGACVPLPPGEEPGPGEPGQPGGPGQTPNDPAQNPELVPAGSGFENCSQTNGGYAVFAALALLVMRKRRSIKAL